MPPPGSLPIARHPEAEGFSYIQTDWFGCDVHPAPGFRLWMGPEALEFSIRLPGCARGSRSAESGHFREGLWRHRCGELFLANPASGAYVEINLSPEGAWWACRFSAPRVRALPARDPWPDAKVEVAGEDTRLRLPRAGIEDWLGCGLASTRGNVAFCLGDEPARKYLSFATPPDGPPNFHRPDLWLPPGGLHGGRTRANKDE